MPCRSLVRRRCWIAFAFMLSSWSSWTTSSFADEVLTKLEGENSFERSPPSSSPSSSSSSTIELDPAESSSLETASSSCSICADGKAMEDEYKDQIPFRDHPDITCSQLDLMFDTGTPCDVIQVAAAARCGCEADPHVVCPLCHDYSLPPHIDQGLTEHEDYATCFDLLVVAAAAPTSNTDCFAVQRLGIDMCGCPTAPHLPPRDNHHRPDFSGDDDDEDEKESLQLSMGAIVGIAMVVGVLVGIVVLCLCSPQCNVMAREEWSSPLELPPDLESSQLSQHLAHRAKLGAEGEEPDPPLAPPSTMTTTTFSGSSASHGSNDTTLPEDAGDTAAQEQARLKDDELFDAEQLSDPTERQLPEVM